MNSIVEFKETMSSLQIAEITGKSHAHVMRDIRNIAQQLDNEGQTNFGLTNYTDAQGKNRSMYELSKKGCLCLAAGYDANLRMKIINRWEELEIERKQPMVQLPNFNDPVIAARAWADQAEKAKLLEQKNKEKDEIIEEQAPFVKLGDAVMKHDSDITINELAKILCQNGMETGEHRLRLQLKREGFLNKNGLPSQKSIESGIMTITKHIYKCPNNVSTAYTLPLITNKGKMHFINKFLKWEGINPNRLHQDVRIAEFKGRNIRYRVIDEEIFIPACDISNIAQIPDIYNHSEGLFNNCTSAQRIVFYANKKELWCIQPYDIAYLCKIGGRTSLTKRQLELIEWSRNLYDQIKGTSDLIKTL